MEQVACCSSYDGSVGAALCGPPWPDPARKRDDSEATRVGEALEEQRSVEVSSMAWWVVEAMAGSLARAAAGVTLAWLGHPQDLLVD